jgi:hypothetical protein
MVIVDILLAQGSHTILVSFFYPYFINSLPFVFLSGTILFPLYHLLPVGLWLIIGSRNGPRKEALEKTS